LSQHSAELQSRSDAPTTVVIEPHSGWRVINFRELMEFRDLFWFLTYRAIRTRYAQSALGLAWAVIQPVATMVVMTVVFGNLVRVESDGAPYAIFSFAALVPWTYFQSALTEAVSTLVAEKNMVSKIYFPRLILPMSRVFARLLDFGVALIILFGLMIAFGRLPNWGALLLPLFILMMIATSAGAGLFFSALAVQYRDVNYAMGFVVRLLMYAAPVIYPASKVPDKWRLLYGLNPMAGVIEGFRSGLLGTVPMPWDLIMPGAVMSAIIFCVGAAYFRRKEPVFADVA
jgi:lipopolysaccharide transport system permease protein